MSAPLVCTIDNAVSVFLLGGMIGCGVGAFAVFVLILLSKWNSL